MRAALLRGIRGGWNAYFVAVPLVLACIEVIAIQTELRLLLFRRSRRSLICSSRSRWIACHVAGGGCRAKRRSDNRVHRESHLSARLPWSPCDHVRDDARNAGHGCRECSGACRRHPAARLSAPRIPVSHFDLPSDNGAVPDLSDLAPYSSSRCRSVAFRPGCGRDDGLGIDGVQAWLEEKNAKSLVRADTSWNQPAHHARVPFAISTVVTSATSEALMPLLLQTPDAPLRATACL